MRSNLMALIIGSFGLVAHAGCLAPGADPEPATADPATETTEAAVVLRVDLEPGHTVTFYEPQPGGLYLAERTAPGQHFVLGDREASDALAAFARVRPLAPVPATLQAAYDRARAMPGDAVAVAPASGGGAPDVAPAAVATPGVIQQALTSSSSAANFVDVDHGCDWGPTWSFCRVNWSNGFFAGTTATSGTCTVDHYAGDGVTIQITVGSGIFTTFQAVHTSVLYGLGSPGTSMLRRIDVLNAGGDSFHAGCHWGN
jgi:hypothetical protein